MHGETVSPARADSDNLVVLRTQQADGVAVSGVYTTLSPVGCFTVCPYSQLHPCESVSILQGDECTYFELVY